METPAGFELNSPLVAGRVAEFFKTRLQNYSPIVNIIPARKLGTEFSPDNLEILQPLFEADIIFMGPGSPSYLARQLRGTKAWEIIRARHRMGAALIFSSAATISVGEWVLPVYEIYKVGEDVHTREGLHFFSDFGMNLSFIPHWNNAEGGTDLDTSRCFVGIERFEQWARLLPSDTVLVGLDEHSGIIMDFDEGLCNVHGVSSVTVLKKSGIHIHPSGAKFPLADLGGFQLPEPVESGLHPEVWTLIQERLASVNQAAPPPQVLQLLEQRQNARAARDFAESDRLRAEMLSLGWQVQDGRDGQTLVKS